MNDVGAAVVHFGSFALLDDCLDELCPQVTSVTVVNHNVERIPSMIRNRYQHVFWDEPGQNLGFSRGVNRALSFLRSTYILVMNPDTRLRPGAVAALVDYMERNPALAIAGPKLLNPDGTLQTSSYRLPTMVQLAGHLLGLAGLMPTWLKTILARTPVVHRFGQLDPHEEEKVVEMVTGACFLIRRVALFDSGPMDPGYYLYFEEKDLCKRLQLAGWRIGFTPMAVAEHAIGGSGPPTAPGAHRHRCMGCLRYFQKHGRVWQRLGARVLLAVYSAMGILFTNDKATHKIVLRASIQRKLVCDSCS